MKCKGITGELFSVFARGHTIIGNASKVGHVESHSGLAPPGTTLNMTLPLASIDKP